MWLLTLPTMVQAQFTFCTNADNTLTVTGYTGSNDVIVIPDTTNGYTVTSIGTNAFFGCVDLIDVVLPASVTNIEESAFDDCASLTSITLPDRLACIWPAAFNSCNSLTNVAIPASVTSIGDYAFIFCSNLTAIVVEVANPNYSSAEGVLFNKSQTTLMQFPGGKGGSYAIPNSVTNLADEAFGLDDQGSPFYEAISPCPNLTNLVIPGSLGSLPYEAFAYCPNLTSVTLGNGLTSIGDLAFYYSGLREATIPGSITNLGFAGFAVCSRLATVTVEDGVTGLDDSEFNFCTNLTSISLPDSLASIGETAFWYCTSLTNVTIPGGVTNIGHYAFSACASLQNIFVNADNPSYSSTDGVLYDKGRTLLIQFPGGKGGNFTIPDGVVSIGDYAFAGYGLDDYFNLYPWSCVNLTSIIFPSSINRIGEETFGNLINLTGLYFEGNAPAEPGDLPPSFNFQTIYQLPGTTGWDTLFGAGSTSLWLLPNPTILNFEPDFGVQTNHFGFTISWATNLPVVVEASTNLVLWQAVQTNVLSVGSAYFSDSQWANYPHRFYRVRSP